MGSVIRKVRKRERSLGEVQVLRREEYEGLELNAKVELIQSLIPLGLMHVRMLLEDEVEALGGRRYAHADGATGTRHGSNPGTVMLDGRRVAIRVPRVRSDRAEIPLRSYPALHGVLESRNQSVAASLAEGLEETLTLHRLGVYGVLGRSFKTRTASSRRTRRSRSAAPRSTPGRTRTSGSASWRPRFSTSNRGCATGQGASASAAVDQRARPRTEYQAAAAPDTEGRVITQWSRGEFQVRMGLTPGGERK